MPPIDSPKTSSPKDESVLIAAISGRALAHAAREAGCTPLVADFFADADMQRLAGGWRKMPATVARGFDWELLEPALDALAQSAPSPVRGLIYGSGFEDRPELLARIAERWPLLGNDAATVTRIKAPETFFATLNALGIPHPATTTMRPADATGWLAKRRGGAGGGHISTAGDTGDIYYQELIEGRALSVLLIANGQDARVLGFSEQWTAPVPGRPWRYGGAVYPAAIPDKPADGMARAAIETAKTTGLKGLASADFVLSGDQFYLLEINPRPGATLDIYGFTNQPPLTLHLDAVNTGVLPRNQPVIEGAAASAVVFAPESLTVPRDMCWPSWAADLPKPGERIDKQRPICTVLARAKTETEARDLVEARKASVLAKIQSTD